MVSYFWFQRELTELSAVRQRALVADVLVSVLAMSPTSHQIFLSVRHMSSALLHATTFQSHHCCQAPVSYSAIGCKLHISVIYQKHNFSMVMSFEK